MIVRRGRPRFTVRLEVPHTGGLRAWGAVAEDLERWLAEQVSPVVNEARVESETRRGQDSVKVRITVTARAADVGQAAVIAWDVFRTAAGEDIAAWDIAAASADIRPAGKAELTVRRVIGGDDVRRQLPARRHVEALPPRPRADLRRRGAVCGDDGAPRLAAPTAANGPDDLVLHGELERLAGVRHLEGSPPGLLHRLRAERPRRCAYWVRHLPDLAPCSLETLRREQPP